MGLGFLEGCLAANGYLPYVAAEGLDESRLQSHTIGQIPVYQLQNWTADQLLLQNPNKKV